MNHDSSANTHPDDTTATPEAHASSTRVDQALDKAQARLHQLREDVQPKLEALSAHIEDLAMHSKAAARKANRQARQTLSSAADQTSAYVADKPLQAMAIAAAAGAALALLLGRRKR